MSEISLQVMGSWVRKYLKSMGEESLKIKARDLAVFMGGNWTARDVGMALGRLGFISTSSSGRTKWTINKHIMKTGKAQKSEEDYHKDIVHDLLRGAGDGITVGEISRVIDRSKKTVREILTEIDIGGVKITEDTVSSRIKISKSAVQLPAHDMQPFYNRKNLVKIMQVSDAHAGSNYQQKSLWKLCCDIAREEKVDFGILGGDLTAGIYARRMNEVFLTGADEQIEYFVNNWPETPGLKWHVVSGNHDWTWMDRAGVNVVKGICAKRDDMSWHGDFVAEFNFGNNFRWRIIHPKFKGLAYARSYHAQKYIENINSEVIPKMRQESDTSLLPVGVSFGHWHIAHYLPMYAGIMGTLIPGLEGITPYLAGQGLSPQLGCVILNIYLNDAGVVLRAIPDFRFFDHLARERDW